MSASRWLWLVLAFAPQWAAAQPQLPDAALLEVAVVVFEAPPARADEVRTLREIEARYVPYLLRTVLEDSLQWGPVRMLPERDASAELQVTGRIVDSSPRRLALQVRAVDSTGRTWLEQEYATTATLGDYPDERLTDPFRPLYEQIAEDLAKARDALSLHDLQRIIEVAQLRHAAALAPRVYGDYLATDGAGRVTVQRLPAENDPMMARLARIREAEYLFVDVVDRHYGNHFRDVGPTYVAWRKARLEAAALMADYRDDTATRSGRDYQPLHRRYDDFAELKLFERTLREQLEALAFESGPTTMDLQGEVVKLTGSLASQYGEWKSLLRQIHAAEVGLE